MVSVKWIPENILWEGRLMSALPQTSSSLYAGISPPMHVPIPYPKIYRLFVSDMSNQFSSICYKYKYFQGVVIHMSTKTQFL